MCDHEYDQGKCIHCGETDDREPETETDYLAKELKRLYNLPFYCEGN